MRLSNSNNNDHEARSEEDDGEEEDVSSIPFVANESKDAQPGDTVETTQSSSTSTPVSLHTLQPVDADHSKFASMPVNGAAATIKPTVWNYLGALTRLTRPENFPGICLFHMLGVYLALERVGELSMYWKVLLADPTLWLVLSTLILTASTSMVVNDYYDTKLGRDSLGALVSGDVPMHLVQRYLTYLYAVALVCVAFLPGVPARLSVVVALMLTYGYTKHFKPVTWVKNVVCAALIAFSPFTSGSAALFRTVNAGNHVGTLRNVLSVPSLWRLVTILFVGFVGREMTMDLNDVTDDAVTGVQTVPVLYGKSFASRFAFLASCLVATLSISFPLAQVLSVQGQLNQHRRIVGRLGLALIGNFLLLRRSWQVYRSNGRNKELNDRAVGESSTHVLFILASFI